MIVQEGGKPGQPPLRLPPRLPFWRTPEFRMACYLALMTLAFGAVLYFMILPKELIQ